MIRLLALLLTAAPAFAAGALPEPVSYTKPAGSFTFVQFGDPVAEEKVRDTTARTQFAELRKKYPTSGLYTASGELVWKFAGDYVPYDNAFPSPDGVHLARLEGEWWTEKEYAATKRLPADEEAKQLAAVAVAFYVNGERVRSYTVSDLLTDPADLKHSPRFVLWAAGAVLTGDRFVVMTQDANQLAFDARTGELLSKTRVGLNNPLIPKLLGLAGGLAAILLAAWAWYAFCVNPIRASVEK